MFKYYDDDRHPMVEEWGLGMDMRFGETVKVKQSCYMSCMYNRKRLYSDDITIKVTITAGSPTAPRSHIDAFQTCILAFAVPYEAVLQPQLSIYMLKCYDHDSYRMDKVNWNIYVLSQCI